MRDSDLVRQTLAGKKEAYEELVHRWAGRVTAVCHARVGCASAAEDLAQESLLRGYRSLASLTAPDKFGSWLCNIAANACISWLRSKQRTQIPFSALRDHDPRDIAGDSSTSYSDHDDELSRLREEVAALPEDCRETLLLYYHHDWTYRDLAEMLGVSPATINARLTRARCLLRERLTILRGEP